MVELCSLHLNTLILKVWGSASQTQRRLKANMSLVHSKFEYSAVTSPSTSPMPPQPALGWLLAATGQHAPPSRRHTPLGGLPSISWIQKYRYNLRFSWMASHGGLWFYSVASWVGGYRLSKWVDWMSFGLSGLFTPSGSCLNCLSWYSTAAF